MRLHPFDAVRPKSELAPQVAAVPYDVVNRDEACELAQGNPHSFLHVGRADIDLPPDVDPHDPRIYRTAREALDRFVAQGVLVREGAPALYLYRQIMSGRVQTGVVGCVHIDDYEQDVIRKHEKTRQDKEDDRTTHVLTLEAHAEPVFLTYRGRPRIDVLSEAVLATEPVHDFTAPDGVRHTVWRISDPAPWLEAFREVPHAYVADGHHRSASAWRAGKERRAANPEHRGDEEYNWFLAVLFPGRSAHHHALQSGGPGSGRQVAGRGAPGAAARSAGCRRQTTLARPGRGPSVCIWPMPGIGSSSMRRASTARDPIGSLDVSLLQDQVLGPILGVGDPRTDKRIDFVGGIRGTAELERRVNSGEMAIAFSLYPTTVDQLMAVSDAGAIMPPKSTWFEPKLRSGLFVHTF